MFALQAETDFGKVVGYYICTEDETITHAWQSETGTGVSVNFYKLVSNNPFALFVLAEKRAAEWGLKEIEPYRVKTFGRVSTKYLEE